MKNHLIAGRWRRPANPKRAGFRQLAVMRCAAAGLFLTTLLSAQTNGTVDFSDVKIPAVQGPMTVLRSTPGAAPSSFVKESLSRAGSDVSKVGPLAASPFFANRGKSIPATTVGLVENNQVHAYWDEQSGDAEIFPVLDKVPVVAETQLKAKTDLAVSTAQQVFGRADVIPHDATQFALGAPNPVMAVSASRTSEVGAVSETGKSLYVTYVPLHRTVSGLPVYGPGSNATLAIGTDGTVQGFVKHWNVGTLNGTVEETRAPADVKAAILNELQPLTKSANVKVLSIELAYFDNHVDSIQPVYRITAKVHFLPQAVTGVTAAPKAANDEFLVRYLPVGGGTLNLGSNEVGAPTMPVKPTGAIEIAPDDPTVGRYVVRNDDPGWVNSANGFWSNITASPNGGLFSNLQYFWAYPYEFNTSELSYVNSVNVALTEVHGDWWYFTTYQNWGDGVDITAIPGTEGYGMANAGQLNYWILHSCEVVPSAIDAPCATDSRGWATPWFNIFKGLHTVVGYRTIMYINDGTTSPFAYNLELGAPVISAWFNAVNSASDYSSHPTYTAHCGTALPMGRPSAVTQCGHSNDTIFNQVSLPAASCLTNYWQ